MFNLLKKLFKKESIPPPVGEELDERIETKVIEDKKVAVTPANYLIELERLKAQFQSIEQLREVYNEKLTNFSERIGELRNALIEKEKEIMDMKVAALKAVEMVNAVQPEKLMNMVQKQQLIIDTFKTRLESKEIFLERLAQEIKNIRNKFSTYRGVEEIIKLNEEIKGELISIQKIKALIEQRSNKVEGMFIEVQKNFFEFQRFKEMVKDIDNSFKSILKEFEDVRIRSAESVKNADFGSLKNEINSRFTDVYKIVESIKTSYDSIKKIAIESDNITKSTNENKRLIKKIIEKNEEIVLDFDDKIANLLNIVELIKQNQTKLAERISEVSNVINGKGSLKNKLQPTVYDPVYLRLKNYINNCLISNYQPEQIIQYLLTLGWRKEDIEKVLNELHPKKNINRYQFN